jgi:gluconolactonase
LRHFRHEIGIGVGNARHRAGRRSLGAPNLPWPPESSDLKFSGIYRISNDGKLSLHIKDIPFPNGIALSPDEKTLYVNNNRPDMYIRAYNIGKDGELSNERELIHFATYTPMGRGNPDGMKVDVLGNVWTTGPGGIVVVSPKGKILGRIQLPNNATNLAFGDDFQTIFITSGRSILRLKTRVKGTVPPFTLR